ncbi:MAG: 50S ribosomal protein L35 [Hyphomicrobiales bacterium]|nr:MAG: 50S ribosomal protein L35 [Hyphomicrobiales bacterium]
MPRVGGKAKTRKSVAKRFKITGTGKILRRRQGARHLLICKNSKRKRRLGQAALVSDADARNVKENLPFSHR